MSDIDDHDEEHDIWGNRGKPADLHEQGKNWE